jgi:hypothetical protein
MWSVSDFTNMDHLKISGNIFCVAEILYVLLPLRILITFYAIQIFTKDRAEDLYIFAVLVSGKINSVFGIESFM